MLYRNAQTIGTIAKLEPEIQHSKKFVDDTGSMQ